MRIEDALLCAEAVISHSLEFNIPVWLLSMDLRKAFDTVSHQKLFEALGHHGIDFSYIELLRALYRNQSGSVHESRYFNIQRGAKQGDPLSTILFNCILEEAFENWKVHLGIEGIAISRDDE